MKLVRANRKRLERRLEEHKGYVWMQARRLAGCWGLEAEDLAQEGYLGIVDADRRYRNDRGAKFLSYARWWIQNRMERFALHAVGPVRLPANKLRAGMWLDYVRLDERVGGVETGEMEMHEVFPAENHCPRAGAEQTLVRGKLEEGLKRLSWRREEVLRGLFLTGKTERELSEELGVTPQAINDAKWHGLRDMRRMEVVKTLMVK